MTAKLILEGDATPLVSAMDQARQAMGTTQREAARTADAFEALSNASKSEKTKAAVRELASAVSTQFSVLGGAIESLSSEFARMEKATSKGAKSSAESVRSSVDSQIRSLKELSTAAESARVANVKRILDERQARDSAVAANAASATQVSRVPSGYRSLLMGEAGNPVNDAAAAAAAEASLNRVVNNRERILGVEAEQASREKALLVTHSAEVLSNQAAYYGRLESLDATKSRIVNNRWAIIDIEAAQAAKEKAILASDSGSQPALRSMRTEYLAQGAASSYTSSSFDPAEVAAVKALGSSHAELAAKTSLSSSEAKRLKEETAAMSAVMNEAHSAVRGLAAGFNAMWLTWGSIAPLIAGAAISTMVVHAIGEFKDFEFQMRMVRAVSEDTSVSMERMMQSVGSIAAEMGVMPVEAAKGLQALAQAGLTVTESIQALPTALRVAALGGIAVADAATTLTGAANAFGTGMGSVEHIGDVFTKAASMSNTSVGAIAESMKQASTIAQEYHQSVEDVGVALIALAKRNITGSAAGTAYRSMMDEFAAPRGESKKVASQLGITLYDPAKHDTKEFFEVFVPQLRDKLKDFDTESQTFITSRLANNRGGKALSAIMGMSDIDLAAYKSQLENSTGMAMKATIEKNDSIQGDLDKLRATFAESLGTAGGTGADSLRDSLQRLKEVVASPEFIAAVTALVSGFTGLVWVFTSVVSAVTSPSGMIASVAAVIAMVSPLGTAAAAAATSVGSMALGITTAGSAAAGAIGIVGTLLTTLLRFTVVGAAITVAVVALGYLHQKLNEKGPSEVAEDSMKRLISKETEYNKELQTSINKIRERRGLQEANFVEKTGVAGDIAKSQGVVDGLQEKLKAPNTGSGAISAVERATLTRQLQIAQADLFKVQDAGYTALKAMSKNAADAAVLKKNQDDEAREKLPKVVAGTEHFTELPTNKGGTRSGVRDAKDAANDVIAQLEASARRVDDFYKEQEGSVDHLYKMGLATFEDTERAKDAIVRQHQGVRLAILEAEISVAKKGRSDVEAAAAIANAKKPGSVTKLSVDHDIKEWDTKLEGLQRSLEKLGTEGVNAANKSMESLSKDLLRADKGALDRIRSSKLELDALQEEATARERLYGMSARETEIEKARYKAEKDFLKDILALKEQIAKYKEQGGAPDLMAKAESDLEKLQEQAKTDQTRAEDLAGASYDRVAADKADPMKGQKQALDEYQDKVKDVAGSTKAMMGNSFKGMEDAVVAFAMTGKLNMTSFATNMISDLIRIQVQQNAMPFLTSMIGLGVKYFTGGSALPNAKGNAFDSTGVAAFATGGVFDSPTGFSFGGGKQGVLAEAGPEAIMPLTRGADGKLGVSGGGGGSVNVTINVIEDSSKAGTQQKRESSSGGSVIDVYVEKIKASIAGDITKGSGAVPAALTSTYGLNRAVGAF